MLLAAFHTPTASKHQQRDLFPVCMLCEKHRKEIGKFFALLGVKEVVERRKGRKERSTEEEEYKIKMDFSFSLLTFSLLFSK